jgi:hypothetical protein
MCSFGGELLSSPADYLKVAAFGKDLLDQKIYIVAKNIPKDISIPKKHWDEDIFVYDLNTNKIERIPRDTQLLDQCRKIIWR